MYAGFNGDEPIGGMCTYSTSTYSTSAFPHTAVCSYMYIIVSNVSSYIVSCDSS